MGIFPIVIQNIISFLPTHKPAIIVMASHIVISVKPVIMDMNIHGILILKVKIVLYLGPQVALNVMNLLLIRAM